MDIVIKMVWTNSKEVTLLCKLPGLCCSVGRNLQYSGLFHVIGRFAINILGQCIGPFVKGQKHKKKASFLKIFNWEIQKKSFLLGHHDPEDGTNMMSQNVGQGSSFLDTFTLEDGTNTPSWKINVKPTYTMQQPWGTKILPHHYCIVLGMAYRHFKFLWSKMINISSLMAWAAIVV